MLLASVVTALIVQYCAVLPVFPVATTLLPLLAVFPEGAMCHENFLASFAAMLSTGIATNSFKNHVDDAVLVLVFPVDDGAVKKELSFVLTNCNLCCE